VKALTRVNKKKGTRTRKKGRGSGQEKREVGKKKGRVEEKREGRESFYKSGVDEQMRKDSRPPDPFFLPPFSFR
jgi:hypothetical protein